MTNVCIAEKRHYGWSFQTNSKHPGFPPAPISHLLKAPLPKLTLVSRPVEALPGPQLPLASSV